MAAHLPSLTARFADVEFVGVSRHGAEALERIREQFGFAMASEDYRDVLAAGVDIVVVASPTSMHHEHATAALRAGADVLCEKPFTLTAVEAWDVVRSADQLGRHLLVSFGWNFAPMIRAAQVLVDRGGIGTLEYLSVGMSSQTRELLSNTGAYPTPAPTRCRSRRRGPIAPFLEAGTGSPSFRTRWVSTSGSPGNGLWAPTL